MFPETITQFLSGLGFKNSVYKLTVGNRHFSFGQGSVYSRPFFYIIWDKIKKNEICHSVLYKYSISKALSFDTHIWGSCEKICNSPPCVGDGFAICIRVGTCFQIITSPGPINLAAMGAQCGRVPVQYLLLAYWGSCEGICNSQFYSGFHLPSCTDYYYQPRPP